MNDALKRIHMQVMWNRLIAVVEEQAQALLRTAFGSITREAGDRPVRVCGMVPNTGEPGGGPFWVRRDDAAWTLPKGEIAPGEDPLDAARREFLEAAHN